MFSVVIPTLNEMKNSFFKRTLHSLVSLDKVEVIIVDGGSRDDTISFVQEIKSIILIQTSEKSRSQRLKIGHEAASFDSILLHHPRSFIDTNVFSYLLKNPQIKWAGLTHQFPMKHFLLRFTSWYSNQVRLKHKGVIYLDHCLFFKRSQNLRLSFPTVDIFEDTLISEQITNVYGLPKLLPFQSQTSPIRFKTNGIYFQSLMNQILKIAFLCKLPHKTMNKIYEKGLELNSIYQDKERS